MNCNSICYMGSHKMKGTVLILLTISFLLHHFLSDIGHITLATAISPYSLLHKPCYAKRNMFGFWAFHVQLGHAALRGTSMQRPVHLQAVATGMHDSPFSYTVWTILCWTGLLLTVMGLGLGHSNKIHCFPFPARIIFSRCMLSLHYLIIWRKFSSCDWARFAEHSKSQSRPYLFHVCQPSGLLFLLNIVGTSESERFIHDFVWILLCIPSTSEFSYTIPNILDLPVIPVFDSYGRFLTYSA